MIHIESAETQTTAIVRVRITDAPPVKASYVAHHIRPFYVEIKYAYRQTRSDLDGWTEHTWPAVQVKLIGGRILKPGPNGEQRIGKATHEADWSSYGTRDVQSNPSRPLPEWLDKLISEMRPHGDLPVVGAQ